MVFLYPVYHYPISTSASMHFCSLKFPNQHFSLSSTSSSFEQSVIWNFPISKTRFLSSSHFALTWTWYGWFNERNSSMKLKHSPQIIYLPLIVTPTMGSTSSSLLLPHFLLPPLNPTLPPFSVTSLNVQSLNLCGSKFKIQIIHKNISKMEECDG